MRKKNRIKNQAAISTAANGQTMAYRAEPVPIFAFGQAGVDFESQVYDQIKNAARLPVAVKAAVLPDGHPGYALPIGGVIALENAVSPSFVGYDIACRMTLSVLDLSPQEFLRQQHNPRLYQQHMQEMDILSFGVEADETYLAYKDIEHVMALQEGTLVRTVARLMPSVVIMGGHADDGD